MAGLRIGGMFQTNQQQQRTSQRDQLLRLLKSRADDWVPLHEILPVAGAQYGARISELRRLGYRIPNKPGGGWFRLVTRQTSEAADSVPAANRQPQEPAADPASLFGELLPDRSYQE